MARAFLCNLDGDESTVALTRQLQSLKFSVLTVDAPKAAIALNAASLPHEVSTVLLRLLARFKVYLKMVICRWFPQRMQRYYWTMLAKLTLLWHA
jgi:hypothetical protein